MTDAIDIFFLDLKTSTSQLLCYLELLSDTEKQRADAFKFDEHRSRYIVAHGRLREILSDYLNTEPEKIVFQANHYYKPLVEGVHFNLSHCQDKMMLAVSQSLPLGVDIEYIDAGVVSDSLAKTSFSEQEYRAFVALSDNEKISAFFHLWTCKEAVIKAIGEGVYFGLKNFTVDVNKTKILSIKNDQADAWQLQHIEAPAGFQAAIAWRGYQHAINLKL